MKSELWKKVICVCGCEAVEHFYNEPYRWFEFTKFCVEHSPVYEDEDGSKGMLFCRVAIAAVHGEEFNGNSCSNAFCVCGLGEKLAECDEEKSEDFKGFYNEEGAKAAFEAAHDC